MPAPVTSAQPGSNSIPEPLDTGVERLCGGLGLTRTVARWLCQRGMSDVKTARRFLAPRLADLTSPDQMADRPEVARRLARAVRRSEPVVVFGDYDCDGLTSAAILTEVLRAVGGRVEPLLANRFDGGYGVSPSAVGQILERRPALLVTCDCGSSDHETLSEVVQRGVEVIVIDHHLVPEQPLPALGFLNPHRPDCGFPYKSLASCGLVLSVAAALRAELGVELDVRRWLDLVAVGTVADVAPLNGDNRAFVRAGLEALARKKRPGMAALFEMAGLGDERPLTGRDVAFRIAPHLNAPGRLGSPKLALDLLLARSQTEARTLAAQLGQVSEARRALSKEMERQALEEIEREGYAQDAAVVLGRPGWNPGVVGIVAGRLASRLNKPVIVVGFDGETGRGSVRGPDGSRLYDALAESSELLVRFGGHQRAAGLELRLERLADLRRRFARVVGDQPQPATADPLADTLPLDALDDPAAVLADLDKLEPCGEGNPRPRLLVRGEIVAARAVRNGHLKLTLDLGRGRRIGGFFLDAAARADLRGTVVATGDLRHNVFPGAAPVELFVESLAETGEGGVPG